MDLGIDLTDVHCIIKFSQSLWLSRYIEFTTVKCTNAVTKFEKDLFKLMNNAVYHHDVKIKQMYESLQKHIKKPRTVQCQRHCRQYPAREQEAGCSSQQADICRILYPRT